MIPLTFAALFLAASSFASPLDSVKRAGSAISAITAAQWAQLNQTVGGKLHQGTPWARPCFALSSTTGNFDLGQCTAVQAGWKNDTIIADNFGGMQNVNWGSCQATGAQCILDFQLPQNPLAYAPPRSCSQGSISTYYVDAHTYQDVQAALAFATQNNVPISVKNSGHDYKGRSVSPGSLSIWVHNLEGDLTYLPSYTAAGCSNAGVSAIRGSAGLGFKHWYEFADQNSVTIVGGSSETVVAGGGWISGAGHSAISNQYGLGVDRILEMSVVLPNGTYVTASRCQHPDLFYALRGSGGGVFGIATSVTFSTVPKLTLQVAYIRFVSLDTNSARKFMQIIIANSLKWASEGWGGYIEPSAMSKQASGMVLMTPKLTNAEAKASMKPLTDYVASLGNIALNNEVDQADSFLQAYNQFLVPNEELVGIGTTIASRFVPKDNFATNSSQAQLLDAFMNGMNTAGTNVLPGNSIGLVYGGAPTQILVTSPIGFPGGYDGTSSVTPAWYSTVWHVLYAPTFSYSASASDIKTLWQKATTAAQFIRDITPNAAYQNEAYYNEPNYGETFWGTENFNRLTAMKKVYDPQNILTCHQCIGWNPSDSRYACYP